MSRRGWAADHLCWNIAVVPAGLAALLVLRGFAPEVHTDAAKVVAPVVDISWDAPPECGSRAEFVEHIETLLGRPLGQAGDPELEVVGRITTEPAGMLLVLEFRQPVARVRELRARSCVELRDAAAVVLAVTIDPLVPLADPPTRPVEPEPEPEPEPELEPEPEPEAEPKPVAPQPEAQTPGRRSQELAVVLRIAGGIQYRALPSIAGGPVLALGLWRRALRAELVGAWWLTGTTHFDVAPEVGATLSLGWVAPRVCGVPSVGRVAFPLCAGIELGGMRAAAFGTADARTRTLAWVAPELGGATHVQLSRPLALWIGVDGVIPLVRPSFIISSLGELHRTPPFAFQALLGLEIRLDAGRATDPRLDGQGVGT
jgi:hypothetical protein